MKLRQLTTSQFRCAAVIALFTAGQEAGASNICVNGGFESDLSNWSIVTSSVSVVNYGVANAPSNAVSNKIGGGGKLLRDLGGDAIVEQVIQLGSIPPGSNLRAGGYFGGGDSDQSRLVVRFLNSSGGEILRKELGWVTQGNRNSELVLIRRESVLSIPSGTVSIAARVELQDNGFGGVQAAADSIFIEITSDSISPPPLPLNTELLNNPSFETGWAPGSPLSLTDLRGWEGVVNGPVVVKPYSDVNPSVPSTAVSCLIGGGVPNFSCVPGGAGNILADSSGGDGVLRQVLDVRGNAAQFATFGSVALRVTGFFGGVNSEDDTSRIDVRFLDENGIQLAPTPPVGPVTSADRNQQTLLMKRSRELFIPSATRFIELDVAFTDVEFGGPLGLVDLVSAMLVTPSAVLPVTVNSNLISNPSFENISVQNSPIELSATGSWVGVNNSMFAVGAYGSAQQFPSTGFGAANGLGGLLLYDLTGDSGIRKYIDVSGSAPLISIGRLNCYFEAWLGGFSTEPDTAAVQVRFLNALNAQVPGPGGLTGLDPVTAADRNNQTTLIKRSKEVVIPPGTVTIELTLQFDDVGFGGPRALADGVRVVVYDILTGGPVQHPGTMEDLRLFSGVNESPKTGPGYDVKEASANDILYFRVDSPNGTFNFTPMVLAANVYPTSGPQPQPPASLPSLAFNPFQMIFLLDGYFCGGFGCAAVLPGGTQLNVFVPTGMVDFSIVVQALAIPVPGIGAVPINGQFAASEGHIINIVP